MRGYGTKRQRNDFYVTPAYAVHRLLFYERFAGNVWECACGDGAISKILEEYNIKVCSTDKYKRGYGTAGIDFLTCRKPPLSPVNNIITNPPYRHAEEFVKKALKIADHKVAMLLKLNFMAGQQRYRDIFSLHAPARIYIFAKRLSFQAGKGQLQDLNAGILEYGWYVWDRPYNTVTRLVWVV
ncbi:MAG TPA: class I SAM-dependent methyltransferase [Puia sp.]|nr:class I SAM-dependent methyltransferase [Puia sp.]